MKYAKMTVEFMEFFQIGFDYAESSWYIETADGEELISFEKACYFNYKNLQELVDNFELSHQLAFDMVDDIQGVNTLIDDMVNIYAA